MSQAKPRFRTIRDYLAYDDGTNRRYELVKGELVELPTESPQNLEIVMFLITCFLQLGIPYYQLGIKYQIEVSSRSVTAREPDLMVHSEASSAAMSGIPQALIRHEMPAPLLVIEVVSPGEPGTENYNRDYIEKRKEYAVRGISEYWLIDPNRSVVIVLTLDEDEYREMGQFRDRDRVISPAFPTLQLAASQILSAGR
jgi:Uma2 family endonuclease